MNASVASPGPYTVPLKLLTDTVAAGSVVLVATAATQAARTQKFRFMARILFENAVRGNIILAGRSGVLIESEAFLPFRTHAPTTDRP